MLRAALVFFLVACAAQPVTSPAPDVAPAAAPADVAPAAVATDGSAAAPDDACLAHADAFDGAADHVIGRCPNCGLGMDGKAEFSTTFGAYTARSCSASCKDALDADPAAVIARSCKK
jgi:hypothetical protein